MYMDAICKNTLSILAKKIFQKENWRMFAIDPKRIFTESTFELSGLFKLAMIKKTLFCFIINYWRVLEIAVVSQPKAGRIFQMWLTIRSTL